MITILNGDCLELMKDISANSVDLVICDLPYGCLGRGGNGKYDRSDRRIEWDIKIDLDAFWKEIKRIRRNEHTPTIHFCNTKFGYELIKSNEKEFRYDLVWSKSKASPSRSCAISYKLFIISISNGCVGCFTLGGMPSSYSVSQTIHCRLTGS